MTKKFFEAISIGFIVAGVWIAFLAYLVYERLEEKC